MTRYKDNLQPEPLTGNGDYGEWCRNVYTLTSNHSPGKPPVTGQGLQFAATREGPLSFKSRLMEHFERRMQAFRILRLFRAEARDGPGLKLFLYKGNSFNRFLYQVLKLNWLTHRFGMNTIKSWLFFLVNYPHRAGMAKHFKGNGRIPRDGIVSMPGNRTERMPNSETAFMPGDDPGMELQSRDGTLFRSRACGFSRVRGGILPDSDARMTSLNVAGILARDGTRKMPDGEVRMIRPGSNLKMARDGTERIYFGGGVKISGNGTDRTDSHRVGRLPRDGTMVILFDGVGMHIPIKTGNMHHAETKRARRFVDKTMLNHNCKILHGGLPGMLMPDSKEMMPQDGTSFALNSRSSWILPTGILKLAGCLKLSHLCSVTRRRFCGSQVFREIQFRWRQAMRENWSPGLLMEELSPDENRISRIRHSVMICFLNRRWIKPDSSIFA